MPVIALGLITEFEQAEAIVGTGDADLIALARTILYNPRRPWQSSKWTGPRMPLGPVNLRSWSPKLPRRALAAAIGVIPTLLPRKSGICRRGGYRTRE
jgi:hypothetical protein